MNILRDILCVYAMDAQGCVYCTSMHMCCREWVHNTSHTSIAALLLLRDYQLKFDA